MADTQSMTCWWRGDCCHGCKLMQLMQHQMRGAITLQVNLVPNQSQSVSTQACLVAKQGMMGFKRLQCVLLPVPRCESLGKATDGAQYMHTAPLPVTGCVNKLYEAEEMHSLCERFSGHCPKAYPRYQLNAQDHDLTTLSQFPLSSHTCPPNVIPSVLACCGMMLCVI